MAALQSGSEPSPLYWGYVQGQVGRIEPESILELQRAVKDVTATNPTDMQRDAAQYERKRDKALWSILSELSKKRRLSAFQFYF